VANLTGAHAVIIVVIVLLLFGAPKLPGLAKSIGQSMKIFKNEIKTDATASPAPSATEPAATPAAPAAVAVPVDAPAVPVSVPAEGR
jgi:sec-independent protein translocase protein TatA